MCIRDRYEALGYVCKVGAECEFYLFQTDEDGEPTQKPLDRGGYLDISPSVSYTHLDVYKRQALHRLF